MIPGFADVLLRYWGIMVAGERHIWDPDKILFIMPNLRAKGVHKTWRGGSLVSDSVVCTTVKYGSVSC
jgi:hypothetical protein